jgi:hypothetical protein
VRDGVAVLVNTVRLGVIDAVAVRVMTDAVAVRVMIVAVAVCVITVAVCVRVTTVALCVRVVVKVRVCTVAVGVGVGGGVMVKLSVEVVMEGVTPDARATVVVESSATVMKIVARCGASCHESPRRMLRILEAS